MYQVMLKRKFKAAYLLFFTIPLVYVLLFSEAKSIDQVSFPDHLYFSARSSSPAKISLYRINDLLVTWQLNGTAYQYFDYEGQLNDSAGLSLKIENLSRGDTVSFLAFNHYHHNELKTLADRVNNNCSVSNATAYEQDGVLYAIVQKTGVPLTVSMPPSQAWEKEDGATSYKYVTALIFLIIFILIIICSPPAKYFIFSCLLTVAVMLVVRGCYHAEEGSVGIKTISGLKKAEFYFNRHPGFTQLKRSAADSANHWRKSGIDLKTNRFIRLDVEDCEELKHLKIRADAGFFHKTWDFDAGQLGNTEINDLIFKNGTFYIRGNDPFIALTTTSFINDINGLLWLEHRLFLFAGLLVFIVLTLLSFWLGRFIDLKFRAIYLLFLLFPLLYYLLLYDNTKPELYKERDCLYFSAMTSGPASVTLFSGKDSLCTWNVSPPGYKLLSFVSKLKDTAGMCLKVIGIGNDPMVSFTAFTIYHDGVTCSLYDRSSPYCRAENAVMTNDKGVLSVYAAEPGKPVKLHLINASSWQPMDLEPQTGGLAAAVFIAAFIILLLLAPSTKIFIISFFVTLFFSGLYYWLGRDIQDQVTISTTSPQRSVESYFSKSPVFRSDDKFPTKIYKYHFITQVELGKYQYIRCDLDDSTKQINNLKIAVKTGLLKKEWDFTRTPPGTMVMNDVVCNNGVFTVCGNDPFFALTTTFFLDPVHQLVWLRKSAFLFITIFVFLLLLLIYKYAGKAKTVSLVLTAFFICILYNGFMFRPFNSDRIRLISEKRDADTLPIFDRDSVKPFMKKLNNYLNDQLNGRNEIISLNNYLYYSVFGELLNNPDVYFGNNGWMFYVGANGRETYENRVPVTQEELVQLKELFEERRDWLKERGIKLYIVFPRISQFIYEEELGSRMYRHHKTSKLDQLLSYLKNNSDLDIIDVEKPLLEAKKSAKTELYYKTGTHWNYYGAYFAYAAIIEYISRDFPAIGKPIPQDDILWVYSQEARKDIDLIDMSALTGYLKGHEVKPKGALLYAGDTVAHDFAGGKPDFPTLFIVNDRKKGPDMVMFHDSYAKFFYPYFCHHFNRSAFFWTNTFNRDLVEEEKPDLVIWEMSDRFIPFYVAYKNPSFLKAAINTRYETMELLDLLNEKDLLNMKPYCYKATKGGR